MNTMGFTYAHTCLIDSTTLLQSLTHTIEPVIDTIEHELTKGYDTDYAVLNLVTDTDLINRVQQLITTLKKYTPKLLIVIGIGGSHLGTAALFQALYGTMYNTSSNASAMRLYFLDTIDDTLLHEMLEISERELQKAHTILVAIVTKSGTTTETVANGAFFIELLQKYYPKDYYNYVVAITDTDSPLKAVACKEKYHLLEVPTLVGGRYSVFSAVGLLPLGLVGVDINAFMAGAHSMRSLCLNKNNRAGNSAALSALIIYEHNKQGKNIHDTFLFSPQLLMLGNWYRQLVGESLGKNYKGITPTVSIGTTDLHSITQLYLAGPCDKITTFVTIAHEPSKALIPANTISALVPALQNKHITFVKDAIFRAVQQAYSQEQRPFMTVTLPALNAYALGQFCMFKICETLYVGHLWNINPFDQPAVELYKNNTRKILSNEQPC